MGEKAITPCIRIPRWFYRFNVRFGSKADICSDVRLVPIADIHSISRKDRESAWSNDPAEHARTDYHLVAAHMSATLIAKLNIVDINTGSSAGFSPLRMRAV